jgi:AcrR family transcriptional regulator
MTTPKTQRKNHDAMQKRMLASAARIVERRGIEHLSIRNLARAMDCSVGTIYNYVEDINDLTLRINGETITWLERALMSCAETQDGDLPYNIVEAYFDFIAVRPKRWRALFLHYPPQNKKLPEWYLKIVGDIVLNVSAILSTYLNGHSKEETRDITVGLWAMLHGLSMLDQQGKLRNVSDNRSLRQIAHSAVTKALSRPSQRLPKSAKDKIWPSSKI